MATYSAHVHLTQEKTMPNCQDIYQQANQLPPLEKLRLAELLLADLDTPNPEIDAVWRDEAQRRWQAYRAGELKTVSYDAVMQKYK